MPSVSSLHALLVLTLAPACSCGVSTAIPDTDPYLVMLVPSTGTAAHGTIRTREDAPCTVDGPALDEGGNYRDVHLGEMEVDWTIPSRSYLPALPVIVSPALANHAISAEPTAAFFRLSLFDVSANHVEGDRDCTLSCMGEARTDAYLVDTGIATDDEVAAADMTIDDVKAVLMERAAEKDARGDGEVEGAYGCLSLLGYSPPQE